MRHLILTLPYVEARIAAMVERFGPSGPNMPSDSEDDIFEWDAWQSHLEELRRYKESGRDEERIADLIKLMPDAEIAR